MCQALLEIMEPEINQIAAQATAQAAKTEAIEIATKMLESGNFSVEQVKQYVPRLSVKEIEAIKTKLSLIS